MKRLSIQKAARIVIPAAFLLLAFFATAQEDMTVKSPGGQITVTCLYNEGRFFYKIEYEKNTVLEPSALGIRFADADFSGNLRFISASGEERIADSYTLISGKKKESHYTANRKVFALENNAKNRILVVFQVSDDGVAFRYEFPDPSPGVKTVTSELSSFHFPSDTRAWLQPMSIAKTGWEHSNPSYEEHYRQDVPVGTPSRAGWVYPALFRSNGTWVLISETGLDSNYCGTRLVNDSASSEYRTGFPDAREVFPGFGYLPKSTLPWQTPWRIITIGTLATIAESTLGTDLARPAIKMKTSFIKPGKASWSWINSKDDSIVYSEQKRYIDYASGMNWQYCLIDADWDTRIGYDRIAELALYGKARNVGLLLWYNSAGDWNTTPYHPRNKLLTHESRESEFRKLKEMGIKGVKIDFFGGDGQSMIRYYHDILLDAARFELLVNFHGATLPRGWQRTYPHLLTTEAIRGFEMVTFSQADADLEPTHCTLLPFTRNAFDPMDFTPVNLYHLYTSVKRRTSSGFELALSVLFLSGIQHYAESPDGMSHMPEFVRKFLRELPNTWDESRFVDASLGKYTVLARRSGRKWYVAGINAENSARTISVPMDGFMKKKAKVILITDSGDESFLQRQELPASTRQVVSLGPRQGFVMVIE